MIIDFNDVAFPSGDSFDLCIVGSGAAALAMVSELLDTEFTVLVLEAGAENISNAHQEVYQTENIAHPFPGSMDGRFRMFGGSTTQWGGQSLPLEPHDFEKKSWIPNSGWPISYAEVAQYYNHVDNFLHLDPISYNTNIYDLVKKSALKINKSISLKFSKWSSKPNLRENFRDKILQAENITLIKNANLKSINLGSSKRDIVSVTATNFKLETKDFVAKKFIIACGGLENARLLLASNKIVPEGLGNENDLVGRYLQDHPNAHIGTLYPNGIDAQSYFNYFYYKKTRFLPRYIFDETFLAQHKILNSSAYFSFITEEDDSFSLAKDLYRKYRRGNLTKSDFKLFTRLFKNIPDLLKIANAFVFKRKIYTPKAVLKLNLMTECMPRNDNKVFLSNELDSLGMPKLMINWQGDELLRRTFKESIEFFKGYFKDIDLGEFVEDKWIDDQNWFSRIKDAKHHIGTTRMAVDSKSGVVDVNCKVFGIANLYIAGSSVFPTSGHSNPTTTIIALSFRLIDHIKKLTDD